MVGRLTEALPARLRSKVISSLAANPKSGIAPILVESINQFTLAEAEESHDRVEQLEASVLTGGLGVAGVEACREALTNGFADTLVIDQDFQDLETREEMLRLALKTGVDIETVGDDETLERFAGIGCLLRYDPRMKT
jgi:peptide subunit release factor 1 (eRF1)